MKEARFWKILQMVFERLNNVFVDKSVRQVKMVGFPEMSKIIVRLGKKIKVH